MATRKLYKAPGKVSLAFEAQGILKIISDKFVFLRQTSIEFLTPVAKMSSKRAGNFFSLLTLLIVVNVLFVWITFSSSSSCSNLGSEFQ